MTRTNFYIIMLAAAVFLPQPGVSFAGNQDVVINEIGAFEPADYEWIEIFNRGSEAVDLTGWKFFENDTNHGLTAFRGDMILETGEYAIIANKADKFAEHYASFAGTLIDSSWTGINESGEAIALKSSDGTIIESFTYLSAPNRSLERANPSLADYTSANWQEQATGHTAGFQNSNYAATSGQQSGQTSETSVPISSQPVSSSGGSSYTNQPPVAKAGTDVAVNVGIEITFDASGSYDPEGQGLSYVWNFGNGATSKEAKPKYAYDYPGSYVVTLTVSDGDYSSSDQIRVVAYSLGIAINEFLPNPAGADKDNEWIELKNFSNATADVSGWQISNQSEKTKSFVIPENTFILPNGFLLLTKKHTKLSLNNSKGSVKLLYPNAELAEEVTYELSAKEGYSAARKSDGSFIWTKNPTPGMNNMLFSDSAAGQKTQGSSIKNVHENANVQLNFAAHSKREVTVGQRSGIKNLLIKPAEAKTVSGVDEEISQTSENENPPITAQAKLSLAQASFFFSSLQNPFQLFNLAALFILIFFFIKLRMKK